MEPEQKEQTVEESIMMLVREMQDNYMLVNGIPREDKRFCIKVLPVGESGMLFLLMYLDEFIGTVLHYGDDVVSTTYYPDPEGEVSN